MRKGKGNVTTPDLDALHLRITYILFTLLGGHITVVVHNKLVVC